MAHRQDNLMRNFVAAKTALMQLRDAFEELTGTPANPDSKKALQVLKTLGE